LRLEVGPKIRVCSIEPGALDSELKYNTTGTAQKMILDLYRKTAVPADTIARAIAYAMEQPGDVDINEIVIRPTAQEF
jgi:NADP-dependent 3-hydroxy acid dehydrogenase YdfG